MTKKRVALLLGVVCVAGLTGTGCGGPASTDREADDGGGLLDRALVGFDAAAPGCENEICGDGLDNDCDDLVDDGCSCRPGASQACFLGPASARNRGQCTDGTMLCSGGADSEFGSWGPCEGSVRPGTEQCDPASVDEDCSGAANEGCQCAPGGPAIACSSDVGECVAGSQLCNADGTLGICMGGVGPATEVCNNLDDDCDGMIDDGLTRNCGSSVGACSPGTETCSAGVWGACEGATEPSTERCNGDDDDCDGTIDDGTALPCGSDVGECSTGTSQCVNGAYATCSGGVGPRTETCNNLDDDCDGMIDTSIAPRVCGTTDVGACQRGTQTCSAGAFGICMGNIEPVTETCNGVDDDCDNMVDEGCQCTNGATQGCGTDVGACVAGTQTCVGGAWGSCANEVGPVPEICGNGLDDDCDNMTDEGCNKVPPILTCPASINTVPLATVQLSGTGSDPDGGAVTFRWTVTTRPVGSSSQPASPTSASTPFFVDLAGSYIVTLTVTDDEGQTASCTVGITAVPPQQIHVELVWDTVYGDADLQMTQAGVAPATAWFTGSAACWFGNNPGVWPPNGPGGNATLDRDDRDGYGPENINIDSSPAAGTYGIGVSYYCSHSVARNPGEVVSPGDGPATGTVKVFCGGGLIATYPNITLDRTGRFIDVARVTWPGCTGMSISNATWTALVQPTYITSPIHCPITCTRNTDCTGGEICNTTTQRCTLD
ncbi:MAG: hypothetical protein IT370_26735 [Deltaproteobacteria bacterium]|nr:hypothetical protein [Deltaproteobacteria bacterium]